MSKHLTAENTTKEESENLWSKILNETSRSVSVNKTPPNIVILGDRYCGKSSLLTRLQGLDMNEITSGMALDYGVIEIKAEDDETVERINVWHLEGEKGLKDLLQFALNEENIANSLIIIALDLSQPWNIVESLNGWLEIAERHVMKILNKLSPGLVDELKNNLIHDFQTYVEPAPGAPAKIHRKKQTEDHVLPPLEDNALSKNIGVPIVIVGCKSDTFEFLEKEYGFKESHFDFIQQYLRRIALLYGATLIYTSAKRDININVLLEFIRYRLTDNEFTHKFQIAEKESIFIPMGSDSLTKIKITFSNQNLTSDENDPYEEIIKVPKLLQVQFKDPSAEPVILAEDDQDFLLKHKTEVDSEKEKEKQQKTNSPSIVAELPPSVTRFNIPTSQGPSISVGTGVAPTITTPERPSAPLSTSVKNAEHQELEAFFDRLINKPNSNSGYSRPLTSTPKKDESLTKQLDRFKNRIGKDKETKE